MTKTDFLAAVGKRLAWLPPADRAKSLEYYAEMIDDRIEDGLSETEAVAAMGTVDEVIAQICSDTPLPTLVRATVRPRRTLRAWEIVLLIVGAPVWAPLLMAALAVIFSLYVTLWSLVLVLYALGFSFGVTAAACIFGCFVLPFTGQGAQACLLLGAGLFFAGVTILWFYVCAFATVGAVKCGGWMLKGIKSLFIRKGEAR